MVDASSELLPDWLMLPLVEPLPVVPDPVVLPVVPEPVPLVEPDVPVPLVEPDVPVAVDVFGTLIRSSTWFNRL